MSGSSSRTRGGGSSPVADGQESLFSMTSEPSEQGNSGQSTSSQADFHAAGRPRPESVMASLIRKLLCGPSSLASFARYVPRSSRSKTWLMPSLSMTAPSGEPFCGTWPRSGMTWRGRAFELATSGLLTGVTGSSPLLGTPTARDWKGEGDPGQLPTDVLALLPTPRASERENRQTKRSPSQEDGSHGLSLLAEVATAVKLLPTSAMADGDRSGATTSPPSAAGKPSTGRHPLRLSADFTEWMMGCPTCNVCGLGFTDPDCPHAATAFLFPSDT